MEPTMISLKVLSAAAAMTLILPIVAPSESFAQSPNPNAKAGRAAGANVRASGGNVRVGGAPAARFNGGAPAARMSGGGTARFSGGGTPRYSGGGGYYHRGGNGFVPGAVAGALVGGAIASQSYGYYGGPAYAPGYYDDQGQYDDQGPVAVVPDSGGGGDDAVAYCMQTYRSYDPRSGTYLGNDGFRHPCP
jgi:hypothetical protein